MLKSSRKFGLDLLRVLAMFGIIGLHLINQGGLLTNTVNSGKSYVSVLFFLVLFYCSVDIFGVLSGYLLFNKKENNKLRLKSLLCTMFFYCVIITLVFYIFNIENVRSIPINKDCVLRFIYSGQYSQKSLILEILFSLFPFLINRYWYLLCYIFLFLMIPYLNEFIAKIDKDKFKKLLITLFILLTCFQSFLFNIDFFEVNNGYSPFWLIYCYLVGCYIGKYEKDFKIENKKIILYFLGSFILSFVLNGVIRYSSLNVFGYKYNSIQFISYISPFTLISSICLLLLLKDITVKNINLCNIFKFLGVSSFSVYIIHCHYLIYDYILKDCMVPITKYKFYVIIPLLFLYIIIIYFLCAIIEYLRIFFIKKFTHIFKN